jgi:hypothetical protein
LKILYDSLAAQGDRSNVICVQNSIQVGGGTSPTGYALEPISLEHSKSQPWPNLPDILFSTFYYDSLLFEFGQQFCMHC